MFLNLLYFIKQAIHKSSSQHIQQCNVGWKIRYQIQWKPLYVITLGWSQSDNIYGMTTISNLLPIGRNKATVSWDLVSLGHFDHINWMITLSVKTLNRFHCSKVNYFQSSWDFLQSGILRFILGKCYHWVSIISSSKSDLIERCLILVYLRFYLPTKL
jgi:hypothetical protein